MMLFFDGQYPHCAAFIRSKIIGMHPRHPVYRAMVECVGNSPDDEKLVASLFSPGTYPRIVIEDLRAQMKGKIAVAGGIYQGECRPDKLNHVDLDMTMCRGVENDPSYTRDLEHFLLHETVHWARFIARKPSRIDGKEAGSWFEHLAYGDEFQDHYEIPCS